MFSVGEVWFKMVFWEMFIVFFCCVFNLLRILVDWFISLEGFGDIVVGVFFIEWVVGVLVVIVFLFER